MNKIPKVPAPIGPALLRPEFGVRSHSRTFVTVRYETNETTDEILHRFTTTTDPMGNPANHNVIAVSIRESKITNWSLKRERIELDQANERANDRSNY